MDHEFIHELHLEVTAGDPPAVAAEKLGKVLGEASCQFLVMLSRNLMASNEQLNTKEIKTLALLESLRCGLVGPAAAALLAPDDDGEPTDEEKTRYIRLGLLMVLHRTGQDCPALDASVAWAKETYQRLYQLQ